MAGMMAGKAGIVTGAAGGIGRATAVAFGREGAAVVVADLASRRADGEETVRLVHEAGGKAVFSVADVTRAADHEALVDLATGIFSGLNFACNNAGVDYQGLLADTPEAEWDRVMAVNLKGVWLGLKAQHPRMAALGGGAIVNVSSLAGLIGVPGLGAYAASKHGVIGLTRTAALEYAGQGIRVNAVCPAAIATPMLANLPPERQLELASPQAIKRLGRPDEVAEAVLWLCSDRSSFMTGAAVPVDAGATAGIGAPPSEG
jgi:NAD(P)-dependent dehydrogenase (short-subunit alcohol dehydrogenase family)